MLGRPPTDKYLSYQRVPRDEDAAESGKGAETQGDTH